MAQKHTHTATNRYPGIFRTVQHWLAIRHRTLGRPLHILSFGCSSGEEMLSLRAYFPEAVIVGCDTNVDRLRDSQRVLRGDAGLTFYSTPENVSAFGPYDAVFAMSVLCQFPDSRSASNLNAVFPFDLFNTLATNIADNIAPGGVFCLFNGNYLFRDTDKAADFVTLRSERTHTNGFIDRFAADGERLTQSLGNRDNFVQVPVPGADLNDADLIDSMHIRKDGTIEANQIIQLASANGPEGWTGTGEQCVGEPKFKSAIPSGAIMSRLIRDVGEAADGTLWARHAWRKTALNGTQTNFPHWYEPIDEVGLQRWTPAQKQALAQTADQLKANRSFWNRVRRALDRV